IPCYNEEAVLPVTAGSFLDELEELVQKEKISGDSRILYVDDGSRDRTWEILREMSREDSRVLAIRQSRNRGHQNA
ncbi:MAG TPA: glycosyltransferase, partial [Lachnospiraceae bacterium]|nr:glycosyltransferase [Lachnospiraceae bacterium]